MFNEDNEIELLRASVKGDATAFETIIKKYQSLVCAITFSATGNVETSEELAQEAFISAWNGLGQLKDLRKFRSWLSTIARNVIKNSFRRKKRDIITKAVPLDDTNCTCSLEKEPQEVAITEQRQAIVAEALEHIPEKYRESLVLFYRQEQSVSEVAEQLELSEGAVRQRLSRGRVMLKKQVAAMVESTISRTGPGKAFSVGVIGSITALSVKSAVAAAGVVTASTSAASTTTATGITAVLGTVTAKVITAAAVLAIGIGAAVAIKTTKDSSSNKHTFTSTSTTSQQADLANFTLPEPTIEKSADQPDTFQPQPTVAAEENIQPAETTEDAKNELTSISPEVLISKIAENEQNIQNIALHLNCTIGNDDWLFYEYDWGYDSGKEFYSGTSYSKDRLGQTSSTSETNTYDGNLYYSYDERPDGKDIYLSGSIQTYNFSFGVYYLFNTLLGYNSTERMTLSDIMTAANQVTVKDKPEYIDAHPCHVVDLVKTYTSEPGNKIYNLRIWIDPERDYRPLKLEKYNDDNDPDHYIKQLRLRLDNIKLDMIDGIWVPVYGQRKLFRTELVPPADMTFTKFHLLSAKQQRDAAVYKTTFDAELKIRKLTIDPASIQLNKGIPAEYFSIEFPNGCDVFDSRIKKSYVIGQSSEEMIKLDDNEWIAWAAQLSVDQLIDILRKVNKLSSSDLIKILAAVNRLVEIGDEAVASLCDELIVTEKAKTQSLIALTLRAIGDPSAVPYMADGLERNLDSSDYGFGSSRDKGKLETIYQQWQLDPSRNSLSLGRPVREITIALEKLTGHSEGHEHYFSHNSQGNRLGTHTVTPEIIDRRNEHRKQVAQQWRLWWQENKEAVLSGQLPIELPEETAPKPQTNNTPRQAGIIAAPEGAELSFAIVPNIGSDRQPSLTKEEYQSYVDELHTNGYFRGVIRGDSYQWSFINKDTPQIEQLPVATYQEDTFVLLCARENFVLRPEFEGRRIWGLKDASVAADPNGNPAISIEFDEVGSQLFHELTKANIGNRLAIEVGCSGFGIVAAPHIMSADKDSAIITGNFSQQQIEGAVKQLKIGMIPIDLTADDVLAEIEQTAQALTQNDLTDMEPGDIVKNMFHAGLAGLHEKLMWFVEPDSPFGQLWQEFNPKENLLEGHKIEIIKTHVADSKAIVVTSFIKIKHSSDSGHFVFYLTKYNDRWLIYDLDIGDQNRVNEDIKLFLQPEGKPAD